MKLDTSEWKNFRVGDLFYVDTGKDMSPEEEKPGYIPVICLAFENNGVCMRIAENTRHILYHAGCITVSAWAGGLRAFFQPEAFYVKGRVKILIPKDNYGIKTSLFICGVLNLENYRYSYGRKASADKIPNTVIKLPATPDGTPNWQFMEDYMTSLHYKPLTTENKPGIAPKLETEKWAFFYIRDIFEITNCCPHDLGNLEKGDIPFIGRTASNNGLQSYVSVPSDEINAPGCISISRVATNIALWQDRPFTTSQHITTLRSPYLNIHSGTFICGLLNHEMEGKFSYGRTIGQKDIDSMRLKLPVTSMGDPDWQFMEDYIKALPYGDRL